MKISLNRQLDTGQLLDLENHVLEVAEEAYMTEEPRPDLDRFAIDGTLIVQSEELGQAIIDFLSLNVPRIIIWKDDKKVVDEFGNSPLDIEGEADRRIGEAAPLSATKQKQIKALQRKADSADVVVGSVDHEVLLKRIKHLKKGGTRKWESTTPAQVVNSLLEDDKPIVLKNKKPEKKPRGIYIRVASPEGFEPEGKPTYYGPFDSVASAEKTIQKYPAFERVDQGIYDYDDGQTPLSCNVMLAIPTGVKAKLPSSFDGDWAWTIQEDCGKPGCPEIPSLKGKGIEVTELPGGPGFRNFKVTQTSAGGMEDDHWVANQISWHFGAKNQFSVGDRKGNSFVVRIPSK